jgi:hypothetical protein
VVSGDLLDRLAATDRLHGDPGLELGTVGAALAHWWEPPFRGGAPPQRLTMGAVQKSQTTSGSGANERPVQINRPPQSGFLDRELLQPRTVPFND